MNRAASSFLISVASLALATTSSTQTAAQAASLTTLAAGSPATANITLANSSCPVDLRAQPDVSVGPAMLIVVAGSGAASQQLNLQLSNTGPRNITQAQITVHGLTANGRVSPAAFGNRGASTIAKQVDLALAVNTGSNASTDLLFKGFTSVRWIDLDSLTYADGSTWQASPRQPCKVVPNRVMLVASH